MKKFLDRKISVRSVLIIIGIVFAMVAALAAMPTLIQAMLSPDVTITYNDVIQTPRDANDNVVYPIVYNGTTYLPVRAISTMLGINVGWDQATKTVSLRGGGGGIGAIQTGTIPAAGGTVSVNGTTRFSFTPDRSGAWQFRTSNNGNSDPILTLFDEDDIQIAMDDDGGDGLNSLLISFLTAGKTYTVNAGFYGSGTGNYTLTASIAPTLPTSGNIRVSGSTQYAFTPNETGMWSFRTTDCGDSDPFLAIFDSHGDLISYDDDGGEGLNSLLYAILKAGETYILHAEFYWDEGGSYTLTVSRANPAIIPASGGRLQVTNRTFYAFTPGQSGMWQFVTSDNGDSDPFLEIYDQDGELLCVDDDSGGNLNAKCSVNLTAGTTYYVVASFFWDEGGSYVLTVSRG